MSGEAAERNINNCIGTNRIASVITYNGEEPTSRIDLEGLEDSIEVLVVGSIALTDTHDVGCATVDVVVIENT